MEYINSYSNEEEYLAAKQESFSTPHVSLLEDTMDIVYDPYYDEEEEAGE